MPAPATRPPFPAPRALPRALPLLLALALAGCAGLPRERAKGLCTRESADRTAQVHVSAGVGMSPFAPYRFACPPEVSLLELVAAAE